MRCQQRFGLMTHLPVAIIALHARRLVPGIRLEGLMMGPQKRWLPAGGEMGDAFETEEIFPWK